MNETWLEETLDARVRAKGPRPLDEVAKMTMCVARAIGRAHVQKRGHGAISPDAVVLCRRRLGRIRRVELRPAAELRRRATQAWMAPESILRGSAASPAGDVWSLGLVVYFALTGERYFRGGDIVSLFREILVNPLVPASARAAEQGGVHHLFEGFDAWFARCVDRDPSRRFASAPQAAASFAVRVRDGLSPRASGSIFAA
jgi:eukaryotic-like serine/threonine-protein kinase